MKKGRTLLILCIFLSVMAISYVNAAVYINEIEVNPPGADSGNEWIEIFNDGAPINLSGWYLQNKEGDNYTLNGIVITKFYVLDGLSGLTNTNQTIKLFDNAGLLKDSFGPLVDGNNDERTWSRMPDGTGDFVFQPATKGIPNQPMSIENKNSTPSCITSGTNVTLSATVNGFCVNKVVFSVLINGVWTNFTGVKLGNDYSAKVNSGLLPDSQNMQWTVFATDCFNTTIQDGLESFYVNSKTILTLNPANANGLNGWYISSPEFELNNGDAIHIYYQWDSQTPIEYSHPFGLEDAPNNANVTGGILELNYWSDICGEQHFRKIIKTDFTNPEIKDLKPLNGENVVNNPRPKISAFLNELYQSNSGIDKSKVSMFLDSIKINSKIVQSGLDADISYIPITDLLEGGHELRIDAFDNAGRTSSLIWNFNITLNATVGMSVYSPENKLYNNKKIPFNISASEVLDKIEYINYNDASPRFKSLCMSCQEYGFSKIRKVTLNEGDNNITIRGTGEFGQVIEKNIFLKIESKQPKIIKTFPEKGFVSGAFNVSFEEENPIHIILNYGNNLTGFRTKEVNLPNCVSGGKKWSCGINVNLFDFDEQEIEYYFSVVDIANNTAYSKTKTLDVDFTPPVINEFGYGVIGNRVEFDFNITENNFNKINYMDYNEGTPRQKTLCTTLKNGVCIKKISFPRGEHNLTIFVSDKAGNLEKIENVEFEIV